MPARLPSRRRIAFTLVELLVVCAVFALMVGLLLTVTNSAQNVINTSSKKASAFRKARQAFEGVTRTVSQATLNTYWDYYDAQDKPRPKDDPSTIKVDESLDFKPVRYGRASELRFITGNRADLNFNSPFSLMPNKKPNGQPNGTAVTGAIFFQAPTGYELDVSGTAPRLAMAETALNTIGYYVEYNKDSLFEPSILTRPSESMRFRLMEFREPANALRIYSKTSGTSGYTGKDWFKESLGQASEGPVYTRVLAENIIALVVLPKLSSKENVATLDPWSLAPTYLYDSSGKGQDTTGSRPLLNSLHQLPPAVEVVMVAIDETSAQRLNELSNNNPISFLGLDQLFRDASKLHGAGGGPSDLKTLADTLTQHGLRYEIFSTDVLIKSAKWSLQ